MALFPVSTGFVELCRMSLGFSLDDSITQHELFELAVHVQGEFPSSITQQGVEFCGLLRGMLKNVPTEDVEMRVMWRRVMRMLVAYKKTVDTAQKHGKFDVFGLHKATPTFVSNLKIAGHRLL